MPADYLGGIGQALLYNNPYAADRQHTEQAQSIFATGPFMRQQQNAIDWGLSAQERKKIKDIRDYYEVEVSMTFKEQLQADVDKWLAGAI